MSSGFITAFANTVEGNYIGPDITGTVALSPSQTAGIFFNASDHNTIGGSAAGAGNVISGNGVANQLGHGIDLMFPGAVGNVILGNLIGTQPDGVEPTAQLRLGHRDAQRSRRRGHRRRWGRRGQRHRIQRIDPAYGGIGVDGSLHTGSAATRFTPTTASASTSERTA